MRCYCINSGVQCKCLIRHWPARQYEYVSSVKSEMTRLPFCFYNTRYCWLLGLFCHAVCCMLANIKCLYVLQYTNYDRLTCPCAAHMALWYHTSKLHTLPACWQISIVIWCNCCLGVQGAIIWIHPCRLHLAFHVLGYEYIVSNYNMIAWIYDGSVLFQGCLLKWWPSMFVLWTSSMIMQCVYCAAGMVLWYMVMVLLQMWHAKGWMACVWVIGRWLCEEQLRWRHPSMLCLVFRMCILQTSMQQQYVRRDSKIKRKGKRIIWAF